MQPQVRHIVGDSFVRDTLVFVVRTQPPAPAVRLGGFALTTWGFPVSVHVGPPGPSALRASVRRTRTHWQAGRWAPVAIPLQWACGA
jgi:hypothetical protein